MKDGRNFMWSAPLVAVALLGSQLVQPLAAQGNVRAQRVAGPPASAVQDTSDAASRAWVAAERKAAAERAMELRGLIVKAGTLLSMGDDQCSPGALRTFGDNTRGIDRKAIDRAIWDLERLVLLYGNNKEYADTTTQSLLRTVMTWEGGGVRPRWDSDEPNPPAAIAPGLMGEFPDPESGKCVRARDLDTVTFWIPGLEEMAMPRRGDGPVLKAYFGREGNLRARDEFTATRGAQENEVLEYVRVAPVFRWDDWAVVGVHRPIERQGTMITGESTGGASYVFRRVGGEWRLVVIARSWG